jgi:hypothetical protein
MENEGVGDEDRLEEVRQKGDAGQKSQVPDDEVKHVTT